MSMLKKLSLLSVLGLYWLFSLPSCSDAPPAVDLLIINADIWTGNDQQPRAQSMAISGDTILMISSEAALPAMVASAKKVVDMEGRFITPGFIDSHVHLLMGGNSLLSVELRDAATQEEFTRRITDYAKTLAPGQWVLEGNWDHTLWGGELPRKEWIDAETKDHPVALYRLDGHMMLANSAALKMAGIDKNTADVAGGEIVRNADGSPTGVLKDNAMNQLLAAIPPLTTDQKKAAIRAATDYFLSHGVTTVFDVDSLGTYEIAAEMKAAGNLSLRLNLADPLYQWEGLSKKNVEHNDWLNTGALKGFVDGSLGSHTAAFREDYTDEPTDKGFFLVPKEELYQHISGADKAGLQVMVHAIGDSANQTLLDVFHQVIQENDPRDRRFRVEHAQHLAPADIARFAEDGIIVSMQPYHAIDDGRWAEELIGAERIKTTYAFKSLLDAGATLAFGSDWPVAPGSPLMGIYAATARQTLDGQNPDGWVPEQKISAAQALLAYTKNGAYAAFEEHRKGTLEVGKLADFVVLSEDITTVAPAAIRDLEVLSTYLGGRMVFEQE
jgi:predicted amidohydrolase YtcJ